VRDLSSAAAPRFQFVHLIPNPFQPFLSQLMLHVGFVIALRAAPVRLVCKMDRLQLLTEDREFRMAEGIIHGDILRSVTIHARMGKDEPLCDFPVTAWHFDGMI
jgi:hypothetical protein